jgi:hypothetical protein
MKNIKMVDYNKWLKVKSTAKKVVSGKECGVIRPI